MLILVGCEESQAVCKAFRELGHEAYSCDLQECSGGHPEWHFQMDVFEAILGGCLTTQSGTRVYVDKWDMGIFFPDCTYLTISANKWYKDQPERKSGTLVGEARRNAREKAIEFFLKLYNSKIHFVAIENPVGVMSSRFRKPDQVLQPWMFGHGETKATCLWLKNLPVLRPTDIVEGREQRLHKLPPSKDRAKLRSKTYSGIAKAMADQWGSLQEEDYYLTHYIKEPPAKEGYIKLSFMTSTASSLKNNNYYLGFAKHRSFNEDFLKAKIDSGSLIKISTPSFLTKENSVWMDTWGNVFIADKNDPLRNRSNILSTQKQINATT